MSPAPSAADTSVALSAHIHALAGAHLASALPPSSPPSTLTHILKLALDDATPSLSLETLLSLSLLCPWEACPPLASLYTRASPSSAVLADAASALLATTPAVPSDKLALLLHAFLKLSTKPTASSPIAQTLRDHADLPRTLRRLSETYPTLPIPHALHLLHALALLGPENLPSPSVLLAELPAEFNDPPAPFTSLWADYQTLFDLSSKVLERGGDWGDVAIRLLGLEGGRAAWEKEALRRERALEPEVVSIAPASTAAASVTGGSALSQLDQASAMSSIQSILPDLPSAFLLAALAHPAFAAPDASTAAERIIQAVLEGAVPGELQPLLEGGSNVAQQGMIATTELVQPEFNEEEDEFLAMARRRRGADVNGNGGDEVATALNFGKLSLGKRELPSQPLPISSDIAERILRLAEIQAEEALAEEEEARRAGHPADGLMPPVIVPRPVRMGRTGLDDDLEPEDDEQQRVRLGGEGSDSEAEDSGLPQPVASPMLNTEALLEEAYMRNKALFDRDSKTRRSKARIELREALGLKDEQIEGWKIMLERDPHKLAALVRRAEDAAPNLNRLVPITPSTHDAGNKSHGGRGGGHGGGGRGAPGGRGGRGANKGSRGHSNQTRTRGADRKARMMGEKA